jgi:hypothetical protein
LNRKWRRREVGPEIVLQFSVEARIVIPILLASTGGIPKAEVLIKGFLIERIWRRKRGEQKFKEFLMANNVLRKI